MDDKDLSLLQPFHSYMTCREFCKNLLQPQQDPVVAILALEGLFRIESEVQRYQLVYCCEDIRNFLRRWRCESPLASGYSDRYSEFVRPILRSLNIFKTLKVPLFIDNYGKKELLSSYGEGTEDIIIDGDTPIFHVTHTEEAQSIVNDQQFKPNDNKNIIEGCWFGLHSSNSVYGSKAFQTTLSQLHGVAGLRQGEIVSYKKEVNVILYAVDPLTELEGLKKPTDKAVIMKKADPEAYVKVSIFVPSVFLPDPDEFPRVVSGPSEVTHAPFCVKEKRSRYNNPCYNCKELSFTSVVN